MSEDVTELKSFTEKPKSVVQAIDSQANKEPRSFGTTEENFGRSNAVKAASKDAVVRAQPKDAAGFQEHIRKQTF